MRFHERRDDLEKDRFAERWASPRLRMAHIVEIGESAVGPYGISQLVSGRLLDDHDAVGMRGVLPALFASLDALRDADLSGTHGYGLWHGDGNAPYTSWRDNLLLFDPPGERGVQRERLARSPIGATEFDAGFARIQELAAHCPEDRWLVHNDLLNNNVIVDADEVVFLDWGASIYGDFLYDWALLTFWWPWFARRWGGIDMWAEVERHVAGSVPRFHERLRCYELDIGIGHIAFQAAHGRMDDARWTAARTLALVKAPLARR